MCERCTKELAEGRITLKDVEPGIIVHHKKHITPENINNPRVTLSFDNLELLCARHHNEEHKSNYELAIFSDIDARKSTDYKFKQGQVAYRADIFVGGSVASKNGFIRVKKAGA